MERYTFSVHCTAGATNSELAPRVTIRPTHLMTNVTGPGQATLTGVIINGKNQLVMSVDAWQFSGHFKQQLYQEFLVEHGLFDKSSQEIDEFVDESELSPPDPCRIDLPNMIKDELVRIEGTFNISCVVTFLGWKKNASSLPTVPIVL